MKKTFVFCTDCEYAMAVNVYESDEVDRIECRLLPPMPFFLCGRWHVKYPFVERNGQGCFSGAKKDVDKS